MTKQKNNKKLLFLLPALAAVAVLFFALEKLNITDFIQSKPGVTVQDQGLTPEQKAAEDKANADAKKDFIEGTPQTTPSTQPQSASIELSARKESDGTVTVFTKLHDISSGSCKLVVTNNTSSDEQTADVIYQPEYSICGGFSVPVSKLGNGLWNISLSVNSGGQVQSKTITFEVK